MNERSAATTWKQFSGLLMVLGIAQIVMGSVCILAPLMAGTALVAVLGVLLLLAGIVETVQALKTRGFGKGGMGYLGGVLAILGGILVLLHPLGVLSFLTMLVVVYLFVDGIQRVNMAMLLRPAEGWGWVMASGIITVLLGSWLLTGWPYTSTWLVGTIIGIGILFRGWTVLMIALAARRAPVAG